MAKKGSIETVDSKEQSAKRLNSHYVADLFWKREPRYLTSQELSNNFGWKTLLLLQFQFQFQLVVLVGNMTCVVVTLREMSFTIWNSAYLKIFYEPKLASVLYIYDVFYALDVLLMIIYKIVSWPEVRYLYSSRPGPLLITELLTIIPYEIAVSPSQIMYHYLRIRYFARVLRLVYMIYTTSISSTKSWLTIYLHFGGWLVFLTFLFCFIISVTYALFENMSLSKQIYYYMLMLSSAGVTNKGFGEIELLKHNIVFYEYTILVFIHIASFIMVSFQICKCACWLVPQMKYAYSFAHRFSEAKKNLRAWRMRSGGGLKNYDRMYERTIINYFKMDWYHNAISLLRFVPGEKIPNIIVKDIALDITWDAFNHSQLFRQVDVPFLRSISVFMERNIFYPGEIVVKKNKMKSCMIYVVTGIIQILSEENGETPVMSLSGGSCIGETTLFVDYLSTCTVVARSYTEVYILKRKRFTRISNLYPTVLRTLGKIVKARYEKARMYRRAFDIQKEMCQLSESADFLHMLYVITTVKEFTQPDRVTTREDRKLLNSLNNFAFCADHLDMLVFPEEVQMISDSVFVSKHFPIIFQPNSLFIDIWNIIVGLIAYMLLFVYPIAVCVLAGEQFTRYILAFMLAISIIWVLDIWIRISTAVRTKHVFYTKISDIVYYRLSTLGFLADILCIIPVGPCLYLLNSSLAPHVLILLETPKLLKVYRIYGIIRKLTELHSIRMVIFNFIRIFGTLFILFYYSTCILYLLVKGNEFSDDYLHRLEMYYNISQQEVLPRFIQIYAVASYFISDTTVFPFLDLMPSYHIIIVLTMQITYCCVYTCIQAIAIATEVVNNREKHEFKEYVSNMGVMLKKVKFPAETHTKVFESLMKQYHLDEGFSFLYKDSVNELMSKNLAILHNYVMYGKHVNEITIFTNLEDNLIMEIARRSKIMIHLSGEVIAYAGELCKYHYFIIQGYCKIIYRDGTEKMLTSKDCISAYEFCMKTPHINTVIAHTDCKLLSLSLKEFTKILRRYPTLKGEIEIVTKEQERNSKLIQQLLSEKVVKQPVIEASKRKSFVQFKHTRKKSTNLDYHVGFPRLWLVLKYVLMRTTILPDGKFLVIWELLRCIFAFVSNGLSPFCVFYEEENVFIYILLSLDITAWVDLYIMHHVCYYNDVGLLIYHPLSTAKYYWSHRFLLDLFACFPIDYAFRRHYLHIYFRFNRILQLWRTVMFLKYADISRLSRKHLYTIIIYFPLTLLAVFYLSSMILLNSCFTNGFDSGELTSCAAGYLINKRMANGTYTPLAGLTANLLLTVTSFAMINTTKIRFQMLNEMLSFSLVVLIGTGFSLWLTAKMVAKKFFRNTDLTTYQQEMRNLLNFYSFRKIDKNIKREVIKHFEYMWMKKSAKNVNKIMNQFMPCFREDVLFSKFGNYLISSSIFIDAQPSFFKSLLLEMNHKVYLKRAPIYRVNDIINKIYFIVTGEVDVLGPDCNKLVVLKEGSLFGSLGKEKYSRQLLVMVAKSNLEVLIIKNTTFHEIIKNYSNLSNYFNRLTIVNVDYLENEFNIQESEKTVSAGITNRKKYLYDFYFKCSPLIKNYEAVKVADNVLIFISCFLGFHYESYQKAVLDTDITSLSILHILDVLFLIRIYLKLHTTFVNAYGIIVYDRREIIANYAKDKIGLYFDIVAGVPLDIFSYFSSWTSYFPIIFHCMRVNRMLRVYLFVKLLQKTQQKLHINVAVIRVCYILTLTTLYIQLVGISLFYTRYDTMELYPEINTKPEFYRNSLFIVAYTTIGAPVNNFSIIFTLKVSLHCIIITILGRFIIALFIAETCATLEAVNKSRNTYKEFATDLREFMLSCDISLPLHDEVMEYINLLWTKYRGVSNPALFRRTPYYLKEATLNAIFGYHLRNHPLIKKFHIDLIRQMAAHMKVIIFFPGNHVVYEGDVDQTMYFLHEGVVDALIKDTLEVEAVALTLESGDSFGLEQGLFPTTPHMYTYKIRSPTVLVALQRKSWYHLLGFFPASMEILNLYYTNPIDTYDENIKNYLN